MRSELLEAARDIMARSASILEKHATPLLVNGVKLAKGYLAEHPEDDEEIITVDWLESVGFEHSETYGGCLKIRVLRMQTINSTWHIGNVFLGDKPTRGHVRRLCSGIGIELKPVA